MVLQNNSVERNWREQRGAGETVPPGMLGPSTSEGDKRRQSLGPGRFVGTTVQYVANDDGSPVGKEADRLLAEVIGQIAALRAELKAGFQALLAALEARQ